MASSITRAGSPHTPTPPRSRLPRKLPETSLDDLVAAVSAGSRRVGERTVRHWREDPKLAAWQLGTAPLWFGSGVPIPARPVFSTERRLDPGALESTTQGAWLAGQIHTLTRRFWLAWIASSTLRGVALGAIACTIWTLGAILDVLPQPRMLPFILVVLVGALVGFAFGFVNRPSVTRVATMLDHTFELRERMISAFTPPPVDLSPRIRSIQLADAANAFEEIRSDVRGAAVLPLREMVIAALAGIALITMLLFNIASTSIPVIEPVQIPAFVPSSERFAREAQEQKAQQLADAAKQPLAVAPDTTPGSSDSGGELTGLRAVGNALGTNTVTAPSASSIAQGDFPGAKEQLKENAQAAADLPQNERDALADELDRAASGMEDGALKDATQKAADGLREGGDAAVTGLNDLADQIGKSGEQATTQGQAPGSGEKQSSSQSSGQSSSSQNGQAGSGQQAQSSESGSAQSGSSSANGASQSDPGSGVAAAPGIGSDPSQGGEGTDPGNAGSGSTSPQGSDAQSSEAGQAGSGGQSSSGSSSQSGQAQPGGAASGQPGSSGQSGSNASQQSSSDSGGAQGGGASGGTSPTNPSDATKGGGGGSGAEQKPSDTAQDGKASSNPPPGNGQQPTGTGDAQQPSSGNETLVLQGTSDNGGVATGNDTGSSSSGSGSGAGAASGGATQGSVGPAGPDSNRVPDRYRDLVKAYFDGDGLPPDEEQP